MPPQNGGHSDADEEEEVDEDEDEDEDEEVEGEVEVDEDDEGSGALQLFIAVAAAVAEALAAAVLRVRLVGLCWSMDRNGVGLPGRQSTTSVVMETPAASCRCNTVSVCMKRVVAARARCVRSSLVPLAFLARAATDDDCASSSMSPAPLVLLLVLFYTRVASGHTLCRMLGALRVCSRRRHCYTGL